MRYIETSTEKESRAVRWELKDVVGGELSTIKCKQVCGVYRDLCSKNAEKCGQNIQYMWTEGIKQEMRLKNQARTKL